MLIEISQSQKDKCFMIPLTAEIFSNRQTQRLGAWNDGRWELREVNTGRF